MKLSLNDKASFVATEHGAEVLNDTMEGTGKTFRVGEIVTLPLWEIMAIFGEQCFTGAENWALSSKILIDDGKKSRESYVAGLVGAKMSDYPDRTPNHWQIKGVNGVWKNWNPLDSLEDAVKIVLELGGSITFDQVFLTVSVKIDKVAVMRHATHSNEMPVETRVAILQAAADYAKYLEIEKS